MAERSATSLSNLENSPFLYHVKPNIFGVLGQSVTFKDTIIHFKELKSTVFFL